MLALDDPRWRDLKHAYHDAHDIPDLLLALAASTRPAIDYRQQPWHGLWSSLCHQDDVYTVSYAALPHIVRIASGATWPIEHSFFHLPAAIEIARRNGRGPPIPDGLANDYHRGIDNLLDVVNKFRHEPWDRPMLRSAAAAQAVAKGQFDIAEAILNLDDDLIGKINRFELD